ncbi:MAG: TRAP transporter small permease [Candidatus Parcubacteria bacterium]|nr:TRAP transporter small permease [Burkholderiales bacterium]
MDNAQEHVLGEDGQFHVKDAPIDLSGHGWEDWLALALFWILAVVVFIQFFTRYALNDSAGWTEEIARYLLICTVFIGASISVRKNNHVQVDVFYRFMPHLMARALSIAIDAVRVLFFGYAIWLTAVLISKIGTSRMAIIDLPIGIVYSFVLFGFVMMTYRAIVVARQHWRQGYSVLERPEIAITETL